jgi:hypothetical protein
MALGPRCGWPARPRTPPPWPDASEGQRGQCEQGRGPGRRLGECWSCQRPGSTCRLAKGHLRRGESTSDECARARSEWRPGGTPTAQSEAPRRREPRAWPTRGDDRRPRDRRNGPRVSRDPGPWAPREERSRDSGRRGRGQRSKSRLWMGPGSSRPRVAQAGSTGPCVAQAGSMGSRVAQAGSTEPRVAQAQVTGPHVVRV